MVGPVSKHVNTNEQYEAPFRYSARSVIVFISNEINSAEAAY
jgi:hypothetical protein